MTAPKRRPGRPKIAVKLDRVLHLRLSAQLDDAIRDCAAADRRDASDWARLALEDAVMAARGKS